MIWGCLDGARWLEGALRLLRACEVYRLLSAAVPRASLTARFPLLGPLWPNVEKFRYQSSPTQLVYL